MALVGRPGLASSTCPRWPTCSRLIATAYETRVQNSRGPNVWHQVRSISSKGATGTVVAPARRPAYKPNPNAREMVDSSGMTMIAPFTQVPPPISWWPGSPIKLAHFAYLLARYQILSAYSLFAFKLISRPSFFSRSPLDFGYRSVVPTAKALHAEMNEALARGDKEVLRAICAPEYYQTLASTIDKRPRGQRTEWELVSYDRSLWFPRLADYQVMTRPTGSAGVWATSGQAIVSIASTQRVARYDDSRPGGGAPIPGSEKTVSVVEHMVLFRSIDRLSWTSGPWRIWGTLKYSTYEDFVRARADEKASELAEK